MIHKCAMLRSGANPSQISPLIVTTKLKHDVAHRCIIYVVYRFCLDGVDAHRELLASWVLFAKLTMDNFGKSAHRNCYHYRAVTYRRVLCGVVLVCEMALLLVKLETGPYNVGGPTCK